MMSRLEGMAKDGVARMRKRSVRSAGGAAGWDVLHPGLR